MEPSEQLKAVPTVYNPPDSCPLAQAMVPLSAPGSSINSIEHIFE